MSLRWGLRVAAATFLAGCASAALAPTGWADPSDGTSGAETVGTTSAAAAGPAASGRAAQRGAPIRRALATGGPGPERPTSQARLVASAPVAPSAVPRGTRRPQQAFTARLVQDLTPYSDWLADYPGPVPPPMLQGGLDLLRRATFTATTYPQRTNPEWSKPTALKLENALDIPVFVAEVHGDSADPDSQSRVLADPVSVAPGEIFVGSPNANGLPNYVQVTKLWLWVTTPPVKDKPEFELVVMTPFILEPPEWHPLSRPQVTVWDDTPPYDNWWLLDPPGKGTAGGRAFFPEGALFFATERTDEIPYADYGNKDFYWAVTKTISKTPVLSATQV